LAGGPGDVAGFAALRTIVQPISGEAHSFEALADGAVFIAGAVFLGLVALYAENLLAGGHRCLRKKLYLRERRSARGSATYLLRIRQERNVVHPMTDEAMSAHMKIAAVATCNRGRPFHARASNKLDGRM
jgi:hypothetical protein